MSSVHDAKECAPGERMSFAARVLRLWEVGGLRMCLAGDASGLTRVEIGDADVELGRSYDFIDAEVRQYSGGWTSVSIVAGGRVAPTIDVDIPQDEAYIEQTYKILAGVQRKKGRRQGRLPAWQHPAKSEEAP